MVKKHRQSKRQPLKKQHRVAKKVAAHHAKMRREAKHNPFLRKKLKKDPGVPNMYPFKEQFLQAMENKREKMEKEKEKMRKLHRTMIENERNDLQALQEKVEQRRQQFDAVNNFSSSSSSSSISGGGSDSGVHDNSRRAYYREFKKLVESSDVVLEVLDARDPMGCRALEVEQSILSAGAGKRIVLVLNKIDLVPRDVAAKWQQFLKHSFPTVLFKSSTQEQKRGLGRSSIPVEQARSDQLRGSECVGADSLVQLLKNYARTQQMKKKITVGVIGYPNVGKSSLINSLKRTRAAQVSSTPGSTKTTQEIVLDKNITLIDCPGIVFATTESESQLVLRNCIKVEQIQDPLGAVEAILTRCPKEHLMIVYNLENFTNPTEFLTILAKKKGKLRQGGIPDFDAAARMVLHDWNAGKIGGYTEPPATVSSQGSLLSAAIVQQWSSEFDLDGVLSAQAKDLSPLPEETNSNRLVLQSEGPMPSDVKMLKNNGKSATSDVDSEMQDMDDSTRVHMDDDEVSPELAIAYVQHKKLEKRPNVTRGGVDNDDDDEEENFASSTGLNRKGTRVHQAGVPKLNAFRKQQKQEALKEKNASTAPKQAGKKAASHVSKKRSSSTGDDDSSGSDFDFKEAFGMEVDDE